ncbi:MAG: tRNA (adenosine(37)-N6)-dimethylallyltransferase MiaA [Planctomycetes bacterium]|nr:tRNA (adenosine(37)-N6)-dimethylallyltransferase MiaA [Planctomycetota bacterium]
MKRFFLLGPTASGKTRVAFALAGPLDAEILSMDSMLVYRGMDLGTAKPTAEEQAQVPHHLIDLVDPHEEFSVARWLQAADEVEAELAARGKNALYVGGTNLYLKARTAGLLESPPIPDEVRAQVAADGEGERGLERLYAELQEVDPESAQRIHPNDSQRIRRAIEMYRATGRSLTAWQQEWRPDQPLAESAVALAWPRTLLRERVARRFDQMLDQGFLTEIQNIRAAGGFGPTAAKALGYRQMLAYLEGECTLEDARERAVTGTRTYIRRQMTWLRSFPDLRWVEMCDDAGRPRPTAELGRACLAALHSSVPAPQDDSRND